MENYFNYNHFTAPWSLSGTTRVSRYQKGKTNLDLLEQEIVSGSGMGVDLHKKVGGPWTIYKQNANFGNVISPENTDLQS